MVLLICFLIEQFDSNWIYKNNLNIIFSFGFMGILFKKTTNCKYTNEH